MGGRAPQFYPFSGHQRREVISAHKKHDCHWPLILRYSIC